MATEEATAFDSGLSIPDFRRYRLRWDTNLLSYATGIYEPYQRFVETGLSYFPPEIQSTLKIVAQKRLNTTLVDLMAIPMADITETDEGFSVGANATLTAMAEHSGLSVLSGSRPFVVSSKSAEDPRIVHQDPPGGPSADGTDPIRVGCPERHQGIRRKP